MAEGKPLAYQIHRRDELGQHLVRCSRCLLHQDTLDLLISIFVTFVSAGMTIDLPQPRKMKAIQTLPKSVVKKSVERSVQSQKIIVMIIQAKI